METLTCPNGHTNKYTATNMWTTLVDWNPDYPNPNRRGFTFTCPECGSIFEVSWSDTEPARQDPPPPESIDQTKVGGEGNVQINNSNGGFVSQSQIGGKNNKQVIK